MSNGLFADRKMALGFAGITVVFAVVATLGADLFLPSEPEAEPEEQIVEAPADTAPRQPAPPAQTWADEGGFSDDWNASSDGSSNGNAGGGWGSSSKTHNEGEMAFGDYSPERPDRGAARAVSNNGSRAGARQARRSSGAGQARITSGASPDAPESRPPADRSEAPTGGSGDR